jgi:hypothetical protein
VLGVTLVALWLAACQDDPSTAPQGLPSLAAAAEGPTHDSLALEPLARALSRALGDVALRRQVAEDFRDSPFPEHGVHAVSYLAGSRGRPLLEAMAKAIRQPPAELLSLAARVPDLALVLPVRWDRVSWTGDSAVVTVASGRTKAQWVQLGQTFALTAHGDSVPIVMDRIVGYPVIAFLRADRSFGSDPENTRSRAPKQQRRTVSTHTETYGAGPTAVPIPTQGSEQNAAGLAQRGSAQKAPSHGLPQNGDVRAQYDPGCGTQYECPCSQYPDEPYCEPDGGGTPPPGTHVPGSGTLLPSGFTDQSCRASWPNAGPDTDGDGLTQQCEYELAYAFRPYLKLLNDDQDRRREEYWAAYPPSQYDAYRVHLFYAFSYYFDHGDPTFNSYKHQGDSEFLVVRVKYDRTYGWQLESAFYAAHWRTPTDASQNVYWYQIEYPGTQRVRPLVWVAREKHGSYNTRLACDRGAYSTDTCDDNILIMGHPEFEAEVGWNYNLGNASWTRYDPTYGTSTHYPGNFLANCVSARETSSPRQECFWTGEDFRGWRNPWDMYGDRAGAGPYRTSLYEFLYRNPFT